MFRLISAIFALALGVAAQVAPPQEIRGDLVTGRLLRYENFPARSVAPRNVDVWLPGDFSKRKRYAVLYMHDGQMLFDASTTWNKQEWRVDETMTRLLSERRIRDTIVVAVWNTAQRREEYMPQKAFEMASEDQKREAAKFGITGVFSDRYLRFLVDELKPFIDKNYPTRRGRADTFVMGSSMGGLISLYAISEYPDVFGGAGCVSTHFPAGDGVMVDYMKRHLPKAGKNRIYFDFGTETLDSTYEPYQIRADEVMRSKGYGEKDWLTRKFPGTDHSEKSWADRLEIPLVFLLGRTGR